MYGDGILSAADDYHVRAYTTDISTKDKGYHLNTTLDEQHHDHELAEDLGLANLTAFLCVAYL